MSQRRIYDVAPKGDLWTVKERGAQRAVGDFDNKADAVERARELGHKAEPAQIVIHKQDGTFQTEHPYGGDPYPPKG